MSMIMIIMTMILTMILMVSHNLCGDGADGHVRTQFAAIHAGEKINAFAATSRTGSMRSFFILCSALLRITARS